MRYLPNCFSGFFHHWCASTFLKHLAQWAAGLKLRSGLRLPFFQNTQYIRSLLYGVGAFEPLVLLGVTAFMLVVALLAAAVPGWRATRLSPTLAIRSVHS